MCDLETVVIGIIAQLESFPLADLEVRSSTELNE